MINATRLCFFSTGSISSFKSISRQTGHLLHFCQIKLFLCYLFPYCTIFATWDCKSMQPFQLVSLEAKKVQWNQMDLSCKSRKSKSHEYIWTIWDWILLTIVDENETKCLLERNKRSSELPCASGYENKIWNWAVAFTHRWNARVACRVPGQICNNPPLPGQQSPHLDIHSLTGLK